MRDTQFRYFRVPSEKDTGGLILPEKKRRRQLWIEALHRVDLTESKIRNMRICSIHFRKGYPADDGNTDNPDYVPNLNMGVGNRKRRLGESKTSKLPNRKRIYKQEVQDNKETTYAEIESVFLNEDLDSPFDPTSLSCENGLESIPTSEIDQKSEKNRTFVEYIYQVLIGLPPSKANQVRQKIYNILFQAEEESDAVVNQAGSSNSTLCNNETEVKYENP